MSAIFKASLSLILKFVPWDTVIAFVVNFIMDKLLADGSRKSTYEKTVTTIGHAAEALAVAQSILADGRLTSEEAVQASELAKDLRKKLLETWADRGDSKLIEATVKAENHQLAENLAKVEQMQKAAEFDAARNNS